MTHDRVSLRLALLRRATSVSGVLDVACLTSRFQGGLLPRFPSVFPTLSGRTGGGSMEF